MAPGGSWARGRLPQGQHLEPEHRKDAGHEVQDEPAQEGQANGQGQVQGGAVAAHGAGCVCADLLGGLWCKALGECPALPLRLALGAPDHLERRRCASVGQHAFGRVGQGNVESPAVGGGRDHLGGGRHDQAFVAREQEALQGLCGTQAPDHQMRCGHGVALARAVRTGQALLGRLKCGPLARRKQRCSGALHGQANQEGGFSRDANVAACEPLRTRNEFQRLARDGIGRDVHGLREQHAALIAETGQRTHRKPVWRGPTNFGGVQRLARRSGPFDASGQARVSWVLPIGVPVWVVRQQ